MVNRKTTRRGALTSFITKNADLVATPVYEEIARLFKLAQQEDIPTTERSVGETLCRLKKAKREHKLSELKDESYLRCKSHSKSTKLLLKFCKQLELIGAAVAEIIDENKRLSKQVRDIEATIKKSLQRIK